MLIHWVYLCQGAAHCWRQQPLSACFSPGSKTSLPVSTVVCSGSKQGNCVLGLQWSLCPKWNWLVLRGLNSVRAVSTSHKHIEMRLSSQGQREKSIITVWTPWNHCRKQKDRFHTWLLKRQRPAAGWYCLTEWCLPWCKFPSAVGLTSCTAAARTTTLREQRDD